VAVFTRKKTATLQEKKRDKPSRQHKAISQKIEDSLEAAIISRDLVILPSNTEEVVMLEIVEKTLLAGIGVLSLTQKKAEELIEDLKERMNLSEEEGKKLLEKLRSAAKDNQEKLEELAQEEVKKACERVGVVTVEDFEKLQRKVAQLEKQLKTQTT
jgi:polyhydroxyalkanoate synthesis regulator phasin